MMKVPMTDNAASTINRGMVNLREEKKALFSVFFCFTYLLPLTICPQPRSEDILSLERNTLRPLEGSTPVHSPKRETSSWDFSGVSCEYKTEILEGQRGLCDIYIRYTTPEAPSRQNLSRIPIAYRPLPVKEKGPASCFL